MLCFGPCCAALLRCFFCDCVREFVVYFDDDCDCESEEVEVAVNLWW